jgi:hypothetical protein
MSTSPTLISHRTRLRRCRRMARIASAVTISLGVAMLLPASAGAAVVPVGLGTASSFAILGGSAITNTGTSIIHGDIGSYPTPTETGVPDMVLTGTDHQGDAVTQQAKTDLLTAYNTAFGESPATQVVTELGGTRLTPGIYSSDTLEITGILTLDTGGDPDALFVFQAGTTLTTAKDSSVVVVGGLACNVYWQVGSSATLGVRSHLVGNVLAATSITATTEASVQGRLLALDGAVTLDTNSVTNVGCEASPPPTTTTTAAPTTTTAAPTTTTAAPTTTTTTAAPTTTTTAAPTTTTAAPTTTTAAPGPTTTAPTAPSAPTTGITGQAGLPGTPTTVIGATPPGSAGSLPTVPVTGEEVAAPTPEVAAPTVPGIDLTSDTPSTSTPAITTNVTERPALPFTGSDPRLPLAGGFTLGLGILLLGLSKRLDPNR